MPVRLWPLVLALLLIGLATLRPVRPPSGWEPGRFDVCLFCGEQGGLDAINNVLLFLPFGAAAAARGWGIVRTALTAAALAGAVELIQFLALSGRYAGLGDIVFNASGACGGALLFSTRRTWMSPTPRAARAGAVLALAGVVGVTAATGWLFTLPVPDEDLTGQWAPRRAVPFTGVIHEAAINRGLLPAGPVDATVARRYRAAARDGRAVIDASVTSAPEPPRGFAPIVRLVSDDFVHLALGQSGDAVVFMPALRSRHLGLRSIAVRVPEAAAPAASLRVEGSVEPGQIRVSAVSPTRAASRSVQLTVGLGWALLLPRPVAFTGTPVFGSLVWLALLAFPLGFCAAAATSPGRASVWWLIVPLTLLLSLVAVPAAAGIAFSGWTEWVGAITGAIAGALTLQITRRAQIVHGGRANAWTAELCPRISGSMRVR